MRTTLGIALVLLAAALSQLAALVETIINPPKGNVVAMRRRKKG